jgi:AraC family cel operon transcriptional repressor
MARRAKPSGKSRHIRLSRLIGADQAFRIALTIVESEGLWRDQEHDHDFPEFFWIQKGAGVHLVNGRRVEISSGCACMMRPPDRHNFRGRPGEPLAIMNLAFPRTGLEHFRRRYFPKGGDYFWTRARLPWSRNLDGGTLRWLNASARELAGRTDSALVLDRFLIELFLRLEGGGRGREPLPEWLRAALDAWRTPEHFRGGAAGFVELCARGREHVNRSLRRCLGVTTTEALNRARLGWAADELSLTDRPILEICYDAGFGNLGHFYKLFGERFGSPPRAWRRRQREIGQLLL